MRILSGSVPTGRPRDVERVRRDASHAVRPKRVGHVVEVAAEAHDRSRLERLQVERVEVELTPSLGVGGEQHLEATVELKPFDRVGAHAPADPVRRLEHHHLVPALGEHAVRTPGRPGRRRRWRRRPSRARPCARSPCQSRVLSMLSSAPSRQGWANTKPDVFEPVGEHPLAEEQQIVGELAPDEQRGAELRHGQHGGPVEHMTQRRRELPVAHRVRRGEVHRPRQGRRQEVEDRGHLVVDRDPALPLAPRAEAPSDAEPEDRQQLGRARRPSGSGRFPIGCGRRRVPACSAGAVAASHVSQSSARKPSPGPLFSVRISSPRSP